MTDLNVNFIHPTDGRTLTVTLDDTLTPQEAVAELLSAEFIRPNTQGYALVIKDGNIIGNSQSFANAGVSEENNKNIIRIVVSPRKVFPARVAHVIDNYQVVINRGTTDGLKEGQRMLIYEKSGEEIFDPDTGESLGYLEIVKGRGKIIYVQEKMATVKSDDIRLVKPRKFSSLGQKIISPMPSLHEQSEELIEQLIPFHNPKVRDMVKPI